MEEAFHETKKLSKEVQRELMQKSDHPAMIRFVVMQLLFLSMCVGVVIGWNAGLWQMILSQIGFGIMCCSIFACIHETVHNTAFRSRALNQLAARIGGLEHLYPATAFQELHFTHHRHTHEPGLDPEISFGNRAVPSVVKALPSYLGWISGLPMLLFKIMMLFFGLIGMPEPFRTMAFPFVRKEVRLKLAIESAYILTVYALLIYIALYVNSGFWGLLTGQVVGHCILAGYLVTEHNGLPYDAPTILKKTRSMRCSRFLKVLMWNMPYHAEHHAYPAIPFHALPKVHEHIKEELLEEEIYPGFHLKVWKGKFKEHA